MLALSGAVLGVACSSFSASDAAPGDAGSTADVWSDTIGTVDANLADATPRRCTTMAPDGGVCFDFDSVGAPGEGWRSVNATNGSITFDQARSVSPGRSVQFRTDPAEVSDGGGNVSLLTSHLLKTPGHFTLGLEVLPSAYDPPSPARALGSFTFAGSDIGVAIYFEWARGSSSCNVRMLVAATPKGGIDKRQEIPLGVIPTEGWSRLRVTSRVDNGTVVVTGTVGASPSGEVRLPFDGKISELFMWVGSQPQDKSPRGMTLNFDDVSLEPL